MRLWENECGDGRGGGRKGVDVEDGGFGLNEGKVERVVSGREYAGFYYVW